MQGRFAKRVLQTKCYSCVVLIKEKVIVCQMKAWEHLKTINHHKRLVMKACFEVGLYKQGLLHDLSKYRPVEYLVGCK